MIAVASASLCLPIVVGCVFLLASSGKLPHMLLGGSKGLGIGGGFVGLVSVLGLVIKTSLRTK